MRTKNPETMRRIAAFAERRFFEDGSLPSLSEIGEEVGLSKSMVSYYLADMRARGMIIGDGVRTPAVARASSAVRRVPVVGTVACGTPILAQENIARYLTVSSDLLGDGEFFALEARGDSMIGVGVNDGDLVIVRRQDYAQDGQIVVALVGDEATLKRYFYDRSRREVRLHPENPTMEDMYFKEVAVQGVAVKVVKDLR